MHTYRVDMPDSTYKIIEADYFMLGDDYPDAYFYVEERLPENNGSVTKVTLVGFAKAPAFIQFDEIYMVKPQKETPWNQLSKLPGQRGLDRNYDGL